ncbi:hypothetical protein [Paenibacillus sanguinis]|uniref:hypothetical protein n=1 Tax=Paenibacillus sanguinis TaxID=225906 RepID=UPI0003772F78|nr:hypothetical protein [Paenibacillus sanguinis]
MAYDVKVDVSPVYELISSFMIYTTRKWVSSLDVGAEWFADIEERLTQEQRQQFAEAAKLPLTDYDVLFAWTLGRQDADEIASFLHELAEADAETLYARTNAYIPSVTNDTIARIRSSYVPLLKVWDQLYFRQIEGRLVGLLQEDFDEKNTLLQKMDADALIEYASGGLVLEPLKPITEVVLCPSIHFRPINTYVFYEGVLFIQYPLDLPELDENEPPMVLKRLTRALAEPQRLRLLRCVADKPKSMQEIMQDMGQPQEQLLHDLLLLRVAGLLRIHLLAQNTEKFSIRPDGAAELQIFLESYIRLS